VNEWLSALLQAVQDVDPVLRTTIAGVGMMLETSVFVGLVVPGDTIAIVASTAVEGWVEYFSLVAVIIAGALAGESIGFALGRFFGPKIRDSRVGKWLGEDKWVRAQLYLDRRGGVAVFISRFLPVLHSLIPLTVGMSTMRYKKFMAWTVPACVIWAFAYVSVGAAAAGGYRQLSDQLHYAGYIFAAVIAAFIGVVAIVKSALSRAESRYLSLSDNRLGAPVETAASDGTQAVSTHPVSTQADSTQAESTQADSAAEVQSLREKLGPGE
jgi:membrane-associated protein